MLTVYDNQFLCFVIRPEFSEYADVWVMRKYGMIESWVRQVRVRPHFFLSGHWNYFGTFFVFLDEDDETVKWVINNTEHIFSTGIEGIVNIFYYAESIMPINGIQGRMQLTHIIHTL